jgi:hypothetical protein
MLFSVSARSRNGKSVSKFVQTSGLLLLTCLPCLPQANYSDSRSISVSGASFNVPNTTFNSKTASFLETVFGFPGSTAVIVSGCTAGNVCTQLDTNTTSGNNTAVRKPAISAVYDHFQISATWTGGTGVFVTVNTTIAGASPVYALGGSFTQSAAGSVSRTLQSKLSDVESILDFGGVRDGVSFADGAITSASHTFTGAAETFSAGDVGKLIQVYGASSTSTISSTYFAGQGLSDMTFAGTFTGTSNKGKCVKITAPDHFSRGTYTIGYRSNATPCSGDNASEAMTGTPQDVGDGMTVTFPSATGYTVGDTAMASGSVGVLATTIATYVSAHVVTLTAAATATVTTGAGSYGSDNHTSGAAGGDADSAAIAVACIAGGTVYYPAGIYLSSVMRSVACPFVTLAGAASGSTLVYAGSGAVTAAVSFAPASPGNCVAAGICQTQDGLNDLTIRGNANSASALFISSSHYMGVRNVELLDAPVCMSTAFTVFNRFDSLTCASQTIERASGSAAPAFQFIPTVGFNLSGTASGATTSSNFNVPVVEGVLGVGISLVNITDLTFTAGTSQWNGIALLSATVGPPGVDKLSVNGVHFENSIADMVLQGSDIVLANVSSGSPVWIQNSNNVSLGGVYSSPIVISSTATQTKLGVFKTTSTITDLSTTTVYTGTACNGLAGCYGPSVVARPLVADCACALHADATVFATRTLAHAVVVTGTDTSLPSSGTFTTTGGGCSGVTGTFTASSGNLQTVTVVNGGLGCTGNPTFVPSSGTLGTSTVAFTSCGNMTNDALAANPYTFAHQWVQGASYWSAVNGTYPGPQADLIIGMNIVYTGTPTIPSGAIKIADGGAQLYSNFGIITPTVHTTAVGAGVAAHFRLVADSNNLLGTYLPGGLGIGTYGADQNSVQQPQGFTFSSSNTLTMSMYWLNNTATNALCVVDMAAR